MVLPEHRGIISIHAPTRGATPTGRSRYLFTIISIHAPTRGATNPTCQNNRSLRNFNPRSHEGSDPRFLVVLYLLTDFNPRSHEGSDWLWVGAMDGQCDFNPRSHEGSDVRLASSSQSSPNISIHAPTRGATANSSSPSCDTIISIHAPTRGATLSTRTMGNYCKYFNPRSHEGSDDERLHEHIRVILFQSTLPRGERRKEPSRRS